MYSLAAWGIGRDVMLMISLCISGFAGHRRRWAGPIPVQAKRAEHGWQYYSSTHKLLTAIVFFRITNKCNQLLIAYLAARQKTCQPSNHCTEGGTAQCSTRRLSSACVEERAAQRRRWWCHYIRSGAVRPQYKPLIKAVAHSRCVSKVPAAPCVTQP